MSVRTPRRASRSEALRVTFVWLVAAAALACGGSYVEEDSGTDPDSGGAGGTPATGGSGGSGGVVGGGGALATGGVPFEEEPCPPTPEPEPYVGCQPLAPHLDCGVDEGCYATLEYPDDRCGRSRYVAYCAPAGSAGQGEQCGHSLDCQSGYVCVVGVFSGARCGQLCSLETNEPGSCPPGLICGETDVPGWGVCF